MSGLCSRGAAADTWHERPVGGTDPTSASGAADRPSRERAMSRARCALGQRGSHGAPSRASAVAVGRIGVSSHSRALAQLRASGQRSCDKVITPVTPSTRSSAPSGWFSTCHPCAGRAHPLGRRLARAYCRQDPVLAQGGAGGGIDVAPGSTVVAWPLLNGPVTCSLTDRCVNGTAMTRDAGVEPRRRGPCPPKRSIRHPSRESDQELGRWKSGRRTW